MCEVFPGAISEAAKTTASFLPIFTGDRYRMHECHLDALLGSRTCHTPRALNLNARTSSFSELILVHPISTEYDRVSHTSATSPSCSADILWISDGMSSTPPDYFSSLVLGSGIIIQQTIAQKILPLPTEKG